MRVAKLRFGGGRWVVGAGCKRKAGNPTAGEGVVEACAAATWTITGWRPAFTSPACCGILAGSFATSGTSRVRVCHALCRQK